jgi:transposase
MNVYLAKFMTYFEIHRLHREGLSVRHISNYLVLNRRTVIRYLSMSEQQYESFLVQQSDRKKILLPYEDFVKERLEKFQDTSAAQMHDWLKEHFNDLPAVSQKTVFNFVCWVRDKYQIPVTRTEREYQMIDELPYGKQAQVDFGEYNMRSPSGSRCKVFFFTIILSRSRFKYVWFTDHYFTSELAIVAHEKAFEYMGGVPDEIVYDQDKVFIVSENGGDIILTAAFRAYTREHSFSLHFCRKSDPESKGKVENLVKYIKQNFLYNRTYHNIETLNDEAMGWLGRTANVLPHAVTRKMPYSELIIERPFLQPYRALTFKPVVLSAYAVRKDNTISYKGNFYSLPIGTFKGKQTQVSVRTEGPRLIISTTEGNQEICNHTIATGKGQKVLNTDHNRDKSTAVHEMINQVAALFPDQQKALEWLEIVKSEKPRYVRDQLIMVKSSIVGLDAQTLGQVLEYCLENHIGRASDFKSIIEMQKKEKRTDPKILPLNPLNGKVPQNALIQPDKSSIDDYQNLLTQKNNK